MIPGRHYIKVALKANGHAYYADRIVNIHKDVKDMWQVLDENKATLTGEYVTTKSKDSTTANPVNQNDRNWAESDHKQAYLEFVVNTLRDYAGERHLPTSITVRTRLWNGVNDYVGKPYEIKYYLPSLSEFDANVTYVDKGDVRVSRYFTEGSSVPSQEYYTVRIDIHKLYDYTEDYVANVAGVYHIDWMIDEDDVGAASEAQHTNGNKWYELNVDLCHYTVISTPILDYRLDLQKIGAEYAYVLNWALTPNKFTYKVTDDLDYNLNIYAFEKNADGTYACDEAYAALDTYGKEFFLQNDTAPIGSTSSLWLRD